MSHDVGVIVLCAMCDSYFLVTITSVEYKLFKGKKGTLALEGYFEKLQNKLEQDRYAQMRCPWARREPPRQTSRGTPRTPTSPT